MRTLLTAILLTISINALAWEREGQSSLTPTVETQQSNQDTCDSPNGYACTVGQ